MDRQKEKAMNTASGIKKGVIMVDIAVFILGLILTISPKTSGDILCYIAGGFMAVFGVIRLVGYFINKSSVPFGSFDLAQGAGLLAFGVLFMVAPEVIKAFISIILGILLIVCGVMKLQYAVDGIKFKLKFWWISLIGAVVTVILGVLSFINPFTQGHWLMLFLGISFIVTSIWDVVCVIITTNMIKKSQMIIHIEAEDVKED
ncbi:MAG: DUF308 domain-containing protein [Eubacteriales bacterium]|nr:DUF308 domain-containing protein [Eubacteriales bacterium]